jgi:hypothetical protein
VHIRVFIYSIIYFFTYSIPHLTHIFTDSFIYDNYAVRAVGEKNYHRVLNDWWTINETGCKRMRLLCNLKKISRYLSGGLEEDHEIAQDNWTLGRNVKPKVFRFTIIITNLYRRRTTGSCHLEIQFEDTVDRPILFLVDLCRVCFLAFIPMPFWVFVSLPSFLTCLDSLYANVFDIMMDI